MGTKLDVTITRLNIRVIQEFARLLKSAPPRPLRKHQLRKILQMDECPFSDREIERKIIEYYMLPFERRTERQFARVFSLRPYPWILQQFVLNFSNAVVTDTEMVKMAGRLRHHFLFLLKPPEEISSIQFLHLAIHRTANPRWDQFKSGIDLEIFADRWRRVALEHFGDEFDDFFKLLQQRILLRFTEPYVPGEFSGSQDAPTSMTDLNMTQTDLDWMKEILQGLESKRQLPLYPLQRGPRSPTVARIEQLARAAHYRFPNRYPQLETTLQKVCTEILRTFNQLRSEKECDTSIKAS